MMCPICGGDNCITYPLMLEAWGAGRNREHWRGVHDRINGAAIVDLKAIPPVIHDDPWRSKILACEHYQPGCCSSPAPYCTRFLISPSREQCIECLRG